MIRTIVFDIGQVLVDFRWREYIKELGFDETICEAVGNATVLSDWWNKVDLGYKKEEYENGIKSEHPELKGELDQFFHDMKRMVEPFEYSKNWLKQLKERGYRIYLLSNYGNYTYHLQMVNFTFREHVDGELISYQVGVTKPDPRIYQLLLERFSINANEAVFIDDNQRNVEAAIDAGMHGIIFESYEQANDELRKLGVW